MAFTLQVTHSAIISGLLSKAARRPCSRRRALITDSVLLCAHRHLLVILFNSICFLKNSITESMGCEVSTPLI
jgi:hypothetical protein